MVFGFWFLVLATQDVGDCFGVEVAATGEDVDATLKLVAESGVGWVSLRFAWGDDPASFDKILVACKARKLKPVVMLRLRPYTIGADTTRPDVKSLENLRDWVVGLAERFDGDGKDDAPDAAAAHHWVVERDLTSIPGASFKARVETLATLSNAVTDADRDALLMIGVPATDEGATAFKRLAAEGACEHVHAVIVQVLTDPARAEEPLKGIQKALKDSGYVRPTWVLTGDMASGGKKTERTQASELVKRTVYFLDRGVDRILWYPLADAKVDLDEPGATKFNSGAGLLTESKKPRLAYEVLKRFAPLFSASPIVKKMDEPTIPKDVTVYQMAREGGRNVYVAWARTTKTLKNQLVLGTNADQVTAADLDGKDVPPGNLKGNALFDLTEEPLIITQK